MKPRPAPAYPIPLPGAVLLPNFYNCDTVLVAGKLLGKSLCRALPDGTVLRLPITEVEAYDGPHDTACHASKGRTTRNAVMFGPAGYWYVYLCYGMHWLLNIVTGSEEYPAAVLIRGTGAIFGPGRVTKHFGVGKSLYGLPSTPESGLWIEDNQILVPKPEIERTPRIGVDYATGGWKEKPYRFVWQRGLQG